MSACSKCCSRDLLKHTMNKPLSMFDALCVTLIAPGLYSIDGKIQFKAIVLTLTSDWKNKLSGSGIMALLFV